MNKAQTDEAARFLVALRAPRVALPKDLPTGLRPANADDVMAIQMATIGLIGPLGAWKVGASSLTTTPAASPLPLSGIHNSPACLAGRLRGVEAEISFRLGHGLPARDKPYREEEVMAAIETCQAAIEVVEPRFIDREKLDGLTVMADLGIHGALVLGEPIAAWNVGMFSTLGVTLDIDGTTRRQSRGGNPASPDLMRLLVWLANSEVTRMAGGLAAGAVLTTGSWTGLECVPPGGTAIAQFEGFAPVEVRFES
jgi:hypothetical protein